MFDGDVDALWVEDMNSVMDDNKLLTLPNGERIRLRDSSKLLFEVRGLARVFYVHVQNYVWSLSCPHQFNY